MSSKRQVVSNFTIIICICFLQVFTINVSADSSFLELNPGISESDLRLFGIAADQFSSHPYYDTASVSVITPSTNFEKKIPLALLILGRSSWTPGEVMAELREAESVFSQCQVSFSPITLIEASFNNNSSYNFDGSDSIFFGQNNLINKPVVIFDEYRRVVDKEKSAGYSNPEYWSKGRSIGSAFLFHQGFIQKRLRPADKQDYSLMSHELAHALFNESHNTIRDNILNNRWSLRKNEISTGQCDYLRTQF